MLVTDYKMGSDLNEITADAKLFFGEEEGQEIMDYIQSNFEYDVFGFNG